MSMNLFLWACTVCYIFATLATVQNACFAGPWMGFCRVWSLYHYIYQLALAREGMWFVHACLFVT